MKVVVNNLEHFYTCDVCNEQVDMRDLGQVFYHLHKGLDIEGVSKIKGKKVDNSKTIKNE